VGQAQDPAPAPQYQERYDIRKFGAVPGQLLDLPAADRAAQFEKNARAVQAAVDAAYADLLANGGVGSYRLGLKAQIYVPPDPQGFRLSRPVFLDKGVGIRGVDGSCLTFLGGYGVYAGVPRRAENDAAYVDAFGVLDATAVPAAGKAYGINLGGVRSLSFRGSPFDLGRPKPHPETGPGFFRNVGKFTIEYAFVFGPNFTSGEVNGSRGWFNGPPGPFQLFYNKVNGRWDLHMTGRGGASDRTVVSWYTSTAPTQKGAVVLDFDSAAVQAYDHATGAVATNVSKAGATWKPGYRLFEPLCGENGVGMTNAGSEAARDFAVYGLKYIDLLRYPTGVAVGTPAVRNDGQPRNDYTSYVRPFAGDFAVLVLPAKATGNDGLVQWKSSPSGHTNSDGFGFLLDNRWGPWWSSAPANITGMRIEHQGGNRYGSAITIGQQYDLHIEKCQLFGFARGADQVLRNTVYTTYMDEVEFKFQGDCGVSLDTGLFVAQRLNMQVTGRTLFRTRETEFRISDVFGADTHLELGSEFYMITNKCSIERWGIDAETSQFPIGIKISRGGTLGKSSLRLVDFDTTGVGDGGVSLCTVGQQWGPMKATPATLILDNAFDAAVNPDAAGIVDVNGEPGWAVDVRDTPVHWGGSAQPQLFKPAPVLPEGGAMILPIDPLVAPSPSPRRKAA
jgi:hypothetical protein